MSKAHLVWKREGESRSPHSTDADEDPSAAATVTVLTTCWQIDTTQLSNKAELLRYYSRAMGRFIQTGRVRYFPSCTYDWNAPGTFIDGKGARHVVEYTKVVYSVANIKVWVYKWLVW